MQRSGFIAVVLAAASVWGLARADDAPATALPPAGTPAPPSSGAGPAAPPDAVSGAPPGVVPAAPPNDAAGPGSQPGASASVPAAPGVPPAAPNAAGPGTPVVSAPAALPAAKVPAVSTVQRVAPDTMEAILGRQVTDVEGKDIGRLVDVLVDEAGQPQAAVIDFGGFLGVGNRKVAVHWSTLHFKPAEAKHIINLDMTPDQIKSAPEYSSADKTAAVVMPADAAPIAR